MLSRVKFLLIYLLSWVLLFEIFRFIFLIYHFDAANQLSVSTTLLTFLYGLRMDLSTAAYITLPVCLFVLASLAIPFFRRRIVYNVYTALLLFIIVLIVTADLEVYKQWAFRIDATPLKYLSSPKEAWASVSHLPLFWILLAVTMFYIGLLVSFKRIINSIIILLSKPLHWAIGILSISLFIGLMVIALRGGLQLAPINQSSVYFSSDNFANQTSINATWNFLHSVLNKSGLDHNPYQFYEEPQAKQVVDSLYTADGQAPELLKTKTPNVLLIIWESFTDKAAHLKINGVEVTPTFNQLKKEGLYFSQLYASGDRTDKGLSAILSGYPALPKTSIIRTPNKAAKLNVLPALFKSKNYQIPFFYGGEPEFANIKSYLLHAGFNPLIQVSDFAKKDLNSKWGAHDGVVAARLKDYLNAIKTPFFATWLTLSSHEPFEVPEEPIFKGNDHTSKFLSSLHYTDAVIADFIQHAKQQAWWNNTLVIIVADHGHPLPESQKRINNFKIPMLWLGGALKVKDTVHNKVMNQTDIAATLSYQFGLTNASFPFSKNTFDSTTKPWSFFSFNNGFGWVEPNGYGLFDHVGKQVIEGGGQLKDKSLEKGKALQQIIFTDFIKR
ncbi:MAG TPA: sulfatase-like hydrolase/transferase [Flavisolibacter sp.]|nr:sulfatase-like hydrolase/transferase [Flavisolibacter sp.]